jgi:hypothetical protein
MIGECRNETGDATAMSFSPLEEKTGGQYAELSTSHGDGLRYG